MKFKSVLIEGFRAFKGQPDGFFDFKLKDGRPANFVSIYAPNGFGKSSFYDAVEWAITNNIARYLKSENNTLSVNSNTPGKKQLILRNRIIPATDPARVSVNTTHPEFLVYTRDVPVAKTGSRDYLFDKNNTDPKGRFFSDVCLAQDAIDNFLKEQRPDDRYAKFMDSYGSEDERYRVSLVTLMKENTNRCTELEERKETLGGGLVGLVDESIFLALNEIVERLNLDGEEIQFFDSSFDKTIWARVNLNINQRNYDIAEAITKLTEQRQSALLCVSKLDSYVTHTKLKCESSDKMTRLEVEKKRALFKTSTQSELDASKNISFELGVKSKWHSDILDLKSNYDILVGQWHDNLSIVEKAQAENVLKNVEKNNVQERIDLQEKKLVSFKGNLNSYADWIEKSSQFFDELDIGVITQREKSELLLEKRELLQRSTLNLQQLKEKQRLLEAVTVDRNCYSSPSIVNIVLDDGVLKNLSQLVESVEAEEIALNALVIRRDLIQSENDKVQEVLSLAKQIVESTHSKHCPVCESSFPSFSDLSEKISKNSGLERLYSELLQEVDSKNSTLAALELAVESVVSSVAKAKSDQLAKVVGEIVVKDTEVRSATREIEVLSLELSQLESRLKEIKDYLLNLDRISFLAHVEKLIADIKAQERSESDALLSNRIELGKIAADIENKSKSIYTANFAISELAGDAGYKKVRAYIAENSLADGGQFGFASENLQRLNGELVSITERVAALEATMAVFEKEVVADISILEVQEKDLIAQINGINELCMPFELAISDLFGVDISELGGIDRLPDVLEHKISDLAISIQGLDWKKSEFGLLSAQINSAAPLIELMQHKETLAALSVDIERHRKLGKSLKSEHDSVAMALKLKVDQFFYTELINVIYSKIDPHPEFKKVSFACDFESEKPRLDIFITDESDSKVSPNLYFSSAQLNILSLSVFLARALHAKSHDGVPVDCILIDDPIQSLDSINILATIDLLRSIALSFNKQIILSTHDENFHELLKKKIPTAKYGSKFISFESFGRVAGPHDISVHELYNL